MIEFVALAIAFLGSSIAAVWDLKTTEIPDEISYIMIAAALLIYGYQSIIEWNYWPIVNSLIVGLSFLGFGFIMYYFGQWGGGDAKVLSAIGFLLPALPSFLNIRLSLPFPVSYMINVFFVGAAYMLLYATVLAIMNRKIIKEFKKEIKASCKMISVASVLLFAAFLAIGFYISERLNFNISLNNLVLNSIPPLVLTIGIFVIWKFAKAVEDVGFKRRIRVKELKVGDVLKDSKVWEGITEKELKSIKSSRKRHVWIKEGVRFAPAFPLALLVSIIFGDAIFLFVKFFV